MKTIWYKCIIAGLFIINILLLYQNHQLKAGATRSRGRPEMYLRELRLPEIPVVNRDSHSFSLRELAKGNAHTMFVFFSPSDCPDCFSEKTLWQEIPERVHLPVYGIGTSPDSREFWQWLENNDLKITVFLDTTFAIEGRMQFRQTPLKVLVDSAGIVIWADPAREPGSMRESFWRDITNALE